MGSVLWRRPRRPGQRSRLRPMEGGRMRAVSRARGLQVSLRVSDLAASEEPEWYYSRNLPRADGAEVALSQREQHDGSFASGQLGDVPEARALGSVLQHHQRELAARRNQL